MANYDIVKFINTVNRPGRTLEEHRRYIAETKGWQTKPLNKSDEDDPGSRFISGADLLSRPPKPKNYAVDHLLPSRGVMMLCGREGRGKSKLMMLLVWCLALGRPFLDKFMIDKKHRVWIFDGEMDEADHYNNLIKTALGLGLNEEEAKAEAVRIFFSCENDKKRPIDISNADDQAWIKSIGSAGDVIIFDSLSTLDKSGSQNSQSAWQKMQNFLLQLKAAGKAVVLLNHTTKDDKPLGTVMTGFVLDTRVMLERPDDYIAEEGIRFVLEFDKSRNFTGDDAKPLRVQMMELDGAFHWLINGQSQCSLVDQILDLMAAGKGKGAAIKELGIPNSTFYDNRNNKNSFNNKLEERYKARRETGTIQAIKGLEVKKNGIK